MTEERSYYGRPVLKEPVWTWEVPVYFFTGGLGAVSTLLSLGARAAGNERLARRALVVSAAAEAVSPVLLVSDLGRPERFLKMLRVFKVTSPMSVGSWVLAASGSATGLAAALELAGVLPRLKIAVEGLAGLLAPALATYTAVLVSDTAVPAWHEAGRELPLIFAGSSAASAGAAALVVVPPAEAGPARRLLLGGAVVEGAAMQVMQRRLGFVGEPYTRGRAGRLARAAQALRTAGSGLVALAGRRRPPAVAGGLLVLGGELCLRLAVVEAGRQSARDPRYTVRPQRERARS